MSSKKVIHRIFISTYLYCVCICIFALKLPALFILCFVSPVTDPCRLNSPDSFANWFLVRFGLWKTLARIWKPGGGEKPGCLTLTLSLPQAVSLTKTSFPLWSQLPLDNLSLWPQLLLSSPIFGLWWYHPSFCPSSPGGRRRFPLFLNTE